MAIVRILSLAALRGSPRRPRPFDQTHPRRAEVDARLAKQDSRIINGVKDGQLTHCEAKALRADAAVNSGHVTRVEQRQINRQENADSRAIRDGRHP